MRILRNSKKLAVDANPILSAIIGGSARKVFIGDETISFYTTEFNFKEIEKYIPVFSAKKKPFQWKTFISHFPSFQLLFVMRNFTKTKLKRLRN